MADFCGVWRGRGDTTTRRGVLGDFLEHYESVVEPLLAPGKALKLGICEGHGTAVIVVVDDDGGQARLVHAIGMLGERLTKKQRTPVPPAIDIPPRLEASPTPAKTPPPL